LIQDTVSSFWTPWPTVLYLRTLTTSILQLTQRTSTGQTS